MTIAIIIFLGMVMLCMLACVKMSGDISEKERQREQQEEDPCDGCPRWEECNGVDEQCPHMKEE